MALYGMSKDDLLSRLNKKRKVKLNERDIFKSEIKLSLLKQIDRVFNKGLSYYIDPKDPVKSNDESIFFRKESFNADLNFGAKQIVNKFEEDKLSFATLAKLADFKIKRKVPVYKLTSKPDNIAQEVREYLYPEFNSDKREFLKNFIATLAEYNILVFEFVETHNKTEKANINGLFLTPNVIVLKRNQKALRREIFTLAHELGHYLLNEEEIDGNISGANPDYDQLTETEKWCSDFAFHFLAGPSGKVLEDLESASASNDYHHEIIEEISQKTHLSTLALYTRLLIKGIVDPVVYDNISTSIIKEIKERQLAEKEKLDREKQKALEEGRKPMGATPKAIISPLYQRTLLGALYSGFITESEFCKRLNIKPEKLDKYLV